MFKFLLILFTFNYVAISFFNTSILNISPSDNILLKPWENKFHYEKSVIITKNYFMQNTPEWLVRMHDGTPFLFKNKISGEKAIICLNPKTGSTLLKYLLRVGLEDKLSREEIFEFDSHGHKASNFSEFLDAYHDISIPRFMTVRNPYSRILSAYLEKIVKNKSKLHDNSLQFGPFDYNRNESYDVFIEKNIKHQNEFITPDFNDHFRLLTKGFNLYLIIIYIILYHYLSLLLIKGCLIQNEFTYDYYLKLEDMAHWYEPFIRTLGLVNVTSSGWNSTNTRYVSIILSLSLFTIFIYFYYLYLYLLSLSIIISLSIFTFFIYIYYLYQL
jgi:hypothetical protein